jgi:hypothetical protein
MLDSRFSPHLIFHSFFEKLVVLGVVALLGAVELCCCCNLPMTPPIPLLYKN